MPYVNIDLNIITSQNEKFKAGNIKNFVSEWEKLTNDSMIIDTVLGCKIDLIDTPHQSRLPRPLVVSEEEALVIDKEIKVMIEKR